MDIPKLLTDAGGNQKNELYLARIKPLGLSEKDKKNGVLNVYMDFDLDHIHIHFSAFPCNEGQDEKQFVYLGNNARSAKQSYVVRDAQGFINYWTGQSKGVMANLIALLDSGSLKSLLEEGQQKGLFNDKGICLDKFDWLMTHPEICIEVDHTKKKLQENGENCNINQFLHQCIQQEGKENIVLIVPRIIKDNHVVVISQHSDYLELINRLLKKDGGTNQRAVCYLCNRLCDDINTVQYTTNLSGSSISKVFVTTSVNYAPDFNKGRYNQSYALCRSCYEKMMFGEAEIMRRYRLRIAGEPCVLLFSSVVEPLNQAQFPAIKEDIDMAFQIKKYSDLENRFLRKHGQDYFQFHMIFYQTDGKSTKVRKTIESISNLRFNKILDLFEDVRISFGDMLPYFSLGNVYHMIPVTTNKKKEQLDINRVLDIYGAILSDEHVDKSTIFTYATEALEKGMRELRAEKIRNYDNLDNLRRLYGKKYGPDWYVSQMVFLYIALLEVLQRLQIVDEEVCQMEGQIEQVGLPDYIEQSEEFMKIHGFTRLQKGLFYMGALTYQVGVAQAIQKHQTKPILDKISYSGMDKTDVLRFYADLLDKVRQYKNAKACIWLLGKSEQIIKQIQLNIGHLDELQGLSEQESVFYLMSGYAFFVKNRRKKDDVKDVELTDAEGVDDDDNSEE